MKRDFRRHQEDEFTENPGNALGKMTGGALSKWLGRLDDFRRNRNFGGKEKIPCDWDWSECSVTCGGGVQKSVVTWKSDEDTECNPPESKQCNSRPCE